MLKIRERINTPNSINVIAMAPTLYSFGLSPYCRSVVLTVRALGLDVDLKTIDLLKQEQLKPEFVAINSQHTVPTLVDGDLVLTESRAICTYLISRYAKDDSLYPKDVITRAKIDGLLYFDCSTLCIRWRAAVHPVMKDGAAKPSEAAMKNLYEALTWLDEKLAQHPDRYLAGTAQPTVADLAIAAWACTYTASNFSLAQYPHVTAWLARCRENLTGFDECEEGAAQYAEMLNAIIKSRA
ncbi:glutathione S-transferase 1-like isoform X1 [Scylla paramamosain]|uniref:glutathione S-transferase 1-like isoform X1 n=2 Tax=Scylla paramamosain TaxID=85552 RepID=UPI00308326E0